MTTYDGVFAAAQELSAADRLKLVSALWESLEADVRPLPSQEWLEEVQRRSDAYDRGEVAVELWDTVRDRARKQAGLNK